MPLKLSNHELINVEKHTIAHYQSNAESFWTGTREHDVSQNIDAFLSALPANGSLDILDFGCGPGRDLCTFRSLGHSPVGLDGCAAFCQMAEKQSGCPTLHQQFLELDLGEGLFDGVFANASLFHIPGQELPRVLADLHRALRPDGILFSSNPRGEGEGWQGQRYGHYIEFETYERYFNEAGFQVLDHYYRPAGQPREQQPWIAIVCQRQ